MEKILLEEYKNKIEKANQSNILLENTLNYLKQYLIQLKNDYDQLKSKLTLYNVPKSEVISINVGGKIFSTFKSTLNLKIKKPQTNNEYYDPHLLQMLISGLCFVKLDDKNAIFIDRDPYYFDYILNYLRSINNNNNNIIIEFNLPDNLKTLYYLRQEAEFYRLESLNDLILNKLGISIYSLENINSTILRKDQFKDLINLCKLTSIGNWFLIYRASINGFGSKDFYLKCENQSKTLVIIKTTQSYVFGGYTDKKWQAKSLWLEDKNAFIFSFINKDNKPILMKCQDPKFSIYCNQFYGPTFGAGHSIYISDNSNKNINSHSNIGLTYKYSNIYFDTNEAKSLLAGDYHFKTEEIEVYRHVVDLDI
jgi:hypothetical protein